MKFPSLELGIIIFIILVGVPNSIQSQDQIEEKQITIIGYADTTLVPNEIFYTVKVEEVILEKGIYNLQQSEKLFWEILNSEKIPKGDIKVINKNTRNTIALSKTEIKGFREYEIKFNSFDKLDSFVERLQKKNIHSGYLSRFSHSNILELEKQLKMNAMQNAIEKANSIMSITNSKVGDIINIIEIGRNNRNQSIRKYSNIQALDIQGGIEKTEFNLYTQYQNKNTKFRTDDIHLSASIQVVFQLQ